MAGALRKTMVYLGLAEEDERYDAYDDYEDYDGAGAAAEQPRPRGALRRGHAAAAAHPGGPRGPRRRGRRR